MKKFSSGSFVRRAGSLLLTAGMILSTALTASAADAPPVNLALGHPESAYTAHNFLDYPGAGFSVAGAFDGNMKTAWAPPGQGSMSKGDELGSTSIPTYIQVDLGKPTAFNRVVVKEMVFGGQGRLDTLQVQTSDDGAAWVTRASKDGVMGEITFQFASVTARYVRIYLPNSKNSNAPAIAEVEIYGGETAGLLPMTSMERKIFQRGADNQADVTVSNYPGSAAEARLMNGSQPLTQWQPVTDGAVRFADIPAGGWYSIEMRTAKGETKTVVNKVGVGDVYLISGQSNSACFGTTRTQASHDTVSTFNAADGLWYPCQDPQPSISNYIGTNGSAWPTMGDILTEKLNVPVGFVLTGRGSALINSYDPAGGSYYSYIRSAIQGLKDSGFRAILWHQGESDAIFGTSTQNYAASLKRMIDATRADAGFEVPWIVANASFHPDGRATTARQQAVRAAQQQVCAVENDKIFLGPDTDTMGLDLRSPRDKVHFNHEGQIRHGRMWADAAIRYLGLLPNTELSSLTVSSGTLTPAFDPAVTEYTLNLEGSVSSLTVTAQAAHADAAVTGAGTIQLKCGENRIPVTVTANGAEAHTYTILATRAHASAAVAGVAPTCEKPGSPAHFRCTACGLTFADSACTKPITDLTIPALGHDWAETVYTWAEDGSSCIASRTCTRDASHREIDEATVTSEVTRKPTFTQMGQTTYTAAFRQEWAQTDTVISVTLTDIPVQEKPVETPAPTAAPVPTPAPTSVPAPTTAPAPNNVSSNSPQTGDSTFLILGLALLALNSAVFTAFYRHKHAER